MAHISKSAFTIHFATINTGEKIEKVTEQANLQYTLLLLIRLYQRGAIKKSFEFTIHFATINTNFIIVGATSGAIIYNTLCYY